MRLTKAGVLGCKTKPKRSGTPSMGLAQETLRGLSCSNDWISAAAGVMGMGDACAGAWTGNKRLRTYTIRQGWSYTPGAIPLFCITTQSLL